MAIEKNRVIIDDDSDIIYGYNMPLGVPKDTEVYGYNTPLDIPKDTETHLEETCEEDSSFDNPHEHEDK